MADVISIITLIVAASNVLVIPLVIKSLDIILYCSKHVKNSKCCCFFVELEHLEHDSDEETKLIKL